MRTDLVVALAALAPLLAVLIVGGTQVVDFNRSATGSNLGTVQGMAEAGLQEDGGGDDLNLTNLTASGMRFGLDASSLSLLAAYGATADYGTLWVGHWNNEHGWREPDQVLDGLVAANVTPAIHLYYWGDDIHHDCFTVGCAGKSMAEWDRLTADLGRHLTDHMQGRGVVVILESEFNKHQVKDDEDLDFHLANKAAALKQGYSNVTVVLGLGNWYPQAWGTWDRAAATSDAIGLQGLAGSTQDGEEHTLAMPQRLLDGARTVQEMFGKPIFIHDIAVSSYPEPDHLETQAETMRGLADGLDDLQAAGVEAVLYRSFVDVASVPLSEHYGEAERHWGLAWRDSGQLKPAGEAWVGAMKAARAVPA